MTTVYHNMNIQVAYFDNKDWRLLSQLRARLVIF